MADKCWETDATHIAIFKNPFVWRSGKFLKWVISWSIGNIWKTGIKNSRDTAGKYSISLIAKGNINYHKLLKYL